MQASGDMSLRAYLQQFEWWNQGLSPDVTQAQRVRMVLDRLQGGAQLLSGLLTAGELMDGVAHKGNLLPPLEHMCTKLIDHVKEDMRVSCDVELIMFS